MGKLTISMAMFNSYVSLPEDKRYNLLFNQDPVAPHHCSIQLSKRYFILWSQMLESWSQLVMRFTVVLQRETKLPNVEPHSSKVWMVKDFHFGMKTEVLLCSFENLGCGKLSESVWIHVEVLSMVSEASELLDLTKDDWCSSHVPRN